ncbi:exonuclease domain-containing protein [Ktedonospora formicarum]|uniref:Exonuclease domain-containing protein n=1 Tax=Ktedonospora formicarum TaxID=2778364 RepID=A0A8J3MZN2_9CHLR|nr:exonuclease domain-containing protein [Ktedonospora formicarum]GHO50960.1 hypothetical protein KSX_91230 [Ktedonospora formicarum]
MSIDPFVATVNALVAQERSKGSVQSYEDLKERIQRRAHLYDVLQRIEDEMRALRSTVQTLPSLPPEREVLWANAVLTLPNLALPEIDTTGLDAAAEIVRVTLIDSTGAVLDDILIKPTRPLSPQVSEINGIHNKDLEHAPTIREAWPRIERCFQGRHVVSFSQDFDRDKLNETANRDQLPRMNFIGEDLRLRVGQYLGNSYISLVEACTRIGQPLPKRPHQTGIDRARGQLCVLQAIANAVTSCNTATQQQESMSTGLEGDSSLEDLDEHPF